MAPLNRSNQKNRPAKSQRATTLEMVRHACPDAAQAHRISESFGLALIDSDGIRTLHRGQLIESADALKGGLAEKARRTRIAGGDRLLSPAIFSRFCVDKNRRISKQLDHRPFAKIRQRRMRKRQ